jgi:hypothetical protein
MLLFSLFVASRLVVLILALIIGLLKNRFVRSN